MPQFTFIPAQPLLDYIESAGGVYCVIGDSDAIKASGDSLALKRHRNNERRTERMEESGKVDLFIADEMCLDLFGVHPWIVYGEAWWEFIGEGRQSHVETQNFRIAMAHGLIPGDPGAYELAEVA